MTDSTVTLARDRLEQRQRELADVLESGAEAARPVELDQTRVGRLSRVDALQQQAMSRETDRRRRLELKRIDAALARVDDETYGYCLECGEPIIAQRLQADPAAPLCVNCAQ